MKNQDIHSKIIALQELTGAKANEMAKACNISTSSYNKRKGGKYDDTYFIEENYRNAIEYFKVSLAQKLERINGL